MFANDTADRTAWLWVAVAVFVTAFSLSIRSAGLYPFLAFAGDEYVHSMLARFTPASEASIPSYLFASIYGTTNLCGDQFLTCARILNAFLFSLSIPLVYLICSKFCSRRLALFVAIILAIGPINSYTAYFTPESPYYVAFLCVALVVLCGPLASVSLTWGMVGLALAFAALIKPHAMFLLPAIAGCAFFGQDTNFRVKDGIRAAAYLILAFFVTKFVLGFLLAGWSGLSFFGSRYGVWLKEVPNSGNESLSHVLKLAFENGVGHLLALSLLFGTVISEIFYIAITRNGKSTSSLSLKRLILINIFVFTSLPLFVSLFTASIAGATEFENNNRIHMRYYNFAFPLLITLAAAQLTHVRRRMNNDENIWLRAAIGVPIGLLILYALITRLQPYAPGFVDSPELRGYTANFLIYCILATLSLFSVLVWIYSRFHGLSVFLFMFFPLAIVLSSYNINNELREGIFPDVWAKASFFAKSHLTDEELGRTVVVGSDITGMSKTLFMLGNPTSSVNLISKGSEYDVSHVPGDAHWFLLIGDNPIKGPVLHRVSIDGVNLILAGADVFLDFRQSSWTGLVSSTKGLSLPEDWGSWSNESEVLLEFTGPLPKHFRLRMLARAFGPNVGQKFTAGIGESSYQFRLGGVNEEVVIEVRNPASAGTIRIDVPLPTSPLSLGTSSDDRKLGIGLEFLKVEPLEDH